MFFFSGNIGGLLQAASEEDETKEKLGMVENRSHKSGIVEEEDHSLHTQIYPREIK